MFKKIKNIMAPNRKKNSQSAETITRRTRVRDDLISVEDQMLNNILRPGTEDENGFIPIQIERIEMAKNNNRKSHKPKVMFRIQPTLNHKITLSRTLTHNRLIMYSTL